MYLYRINNTIYPDKYFNFTLTVANLQLAPLIHSHVISDVIGLQEILDDKAIVAYKRKLKQNVLVHIESLLNDFTVFRHIFVIKDYPFLDKEYASAKNLLPILDTKSVPFCQTKKTAVMKPQARFLFVHTDSEENQAWNATYPQYFNTTPISENIVSVYKIIGLRLQNLTIDEVILD